MAGRRHTRTAAGQPVPLKRADSRAVRSRQRMRDRLAGATAEEQLAAVYDALRSAARSSPRGPEAVARARDQLALLLAWTQNGGDAW